MKHRDLIEKFRSADATVGIMGLGYVGLPLILTFSKAGHRMIGFDVDDAKIEALRAGRSYIKHIPSGRLAELVESRRFEPTSDFARVSDCDAVLICVPTPLSENREPDMSYVVSTARSIVPHLRSGQLIVLESTTYPGTTDGILLQTLSEGSTLVAGEDYWLAYSPEREDPGNARFDTQTIPKVVGGLTEACSEVACALYGSALDRVIPVSTPAVAEMTKLLENIFRSVNIALVNELKILCHQMGIDVWEVIQSAATKPFGYMPFYPGPGLGGHCIPIDPFYLTWKAREYDLSTRFIELAGEINTGMPSYVVQRTAEALNHHKKPLNGSRVLILGVAYKRDVDDVRESPALRIIELFQKAGSQVSYHDPFVPRTHRMRRHDLDLKSLPLDPTTLSACDVAVIVTDHSDIDYDAVVAHAPLTVDTRNATREVTGNRERIVHA